MPASHTSKISLLEMVFPPISNQDAIRIKNEVTIEARMRQSDLYMIAGKPRYKFGDLHFDRTTTTLTFNIYIADKILDKGAINLLELPCTANEKISSFDLAAGKYFISILDGPRSQASTRLIERFTPEDILWHRSRGLPGLTGLDSYRELSTYDLLYVGIAKVGDSYSRLIAKAHHARTEIIGNEPQRYPGARVTDEIFLFLYKIDSLFIQNLDQASESPNDEIASSYNPKKIVTDAEKAFVSLLQPKYNVVKFKNYPFSKDGLYETGFKSYSYSIGEAITFNTAHGKIKGGRHSIMGAISDEADFILIEGNNVSLCVSGVDFHPEPI